jgi:hypothetical protein
MTAMGLGRVKRRRSEGHGFGEAYLAVRGRKNEELALRYTLMAASSVLLPMRFMTRVRL